MMRPTIPDGSTLWERQRVAVTQTLYVAVKDFLADKRKPWKTEVDLNRQLYFKLLRAKRTVERSGVVILGQLMSDASNLPNDESLEAVTPRERKKPDFQWVWWDDTDDGDQISYSIECKLLGIPKRNDWIYNANYVERGIRRFVDADWGYGLGVGAGSMVGYVHRGNLSDILSEVNAAACAAGISNLQLSSGCWGLGGLHSLDHEFDRSFPVAPFALAHIWVDLQAPTATVAGVAA